ncbi:MULTISPECIES: type I restriction endonuclease subunit R [unclassified Fibrobacter]|uniref:type I restriction endonuclease subunit R n=1 Tax=unclassified Fibrobacter TaxID=2634177 RepID=UPI000920E35B|nr:MULTISPECIES: type I restriction endonuclease subunit R [unclassified Fibrobacter]OWV01369.1 DEAD/DEAH box helicase [Fibrobacter sp. UWH3]SHL89628.1 type I restriction enzyme, R subunit [Fibrobacter sp. UWH6]
MQYKTVAETSEATVVAEYTPARSRSDAYQSEADLEREFIKMLQNQGYGYLQIHTEDDLVQNLRTQIENLNNFKFTDGEWDRFFTEFIANRNEGIVEKTRTIQEDYVKTLKTDKGASKNIKLIDKANIHNNTLQVINQYEEEQGTHNTRYDVSILVNGLPLVHVELKRRGVAIREAFNQIDRYQRDSFWAGSGLYEYVQIFVISNGTHTKYYSNTTRNAHIKELAVGGSKKNIKTSNSFEFTSFWADGNNKNIPDLVDFTKTFLAKHTILNVLTKYCVFTSEELLLVMRPYQITATERILNRITIANNYKTMGKLDAGGYIWHTTGSGKTLTSFKTAVLASGLDYVDKVLFVVDRQDLDYQTMKEYDRFQKGAANGNKSTKILQDQLEDRNQKGGHHEYKIIVTTIQKLGCFITKNKTHDIYKKHIVFVFDECHRSHFGELHQKITKTFKNYHLFGFTGTPIFPQNAGSSKNPLLKTTEQAFGDKLHHYTIVNAINDGNVLPFRIDYVNTVQVKKNLVDKKVSAIDTEEAMCDPKRIAEIVSYVLEHFDQKTKRNTFYQVKDQRLCGFNSIFATASIPMAKKYYEEFKKQIKAKYSPLKIATVFSYAPNEEDVGGILTEEEFETGAMSKSDRDFLDSAIKDYNKTFSTNFDTSGDKFLNYYKDISQRMKKREIDLLIVVNMFLTGFDATTLNTLWVDKNLKQHGLLQAYSRTNRILNSVKTFGNIVCFRSLQKETDDAIALFGDKDAGGIVILKTFSEYYNGYKDDKGKKQPGYKQLLDELKTMYPLGQEILGEKAEKEFIRLFGAVLRLRNILSSFDQFNDLDISERDLQDYQSIYVDLHDKYAHQQNGSKESIRDDIEFELELIKQVDINIDYILALVAQYHDSNCKDKKIKAQITKALNASVELRSKRELIEAFVKKVNVDTDVDKDWKEFVKEQQENDLVQIISDENLKEEETREFIINSFRDGELDESGTDIANIMPKMSRFGGGNRSEKKADVIAKLRQFFEKYFGLITFEDEDKELVSNLVKMPYNAIGESFISSMAAEGKAEYDAGKK